MHIALLTDGISPYVTGGMQRHSFHLARNLLKKGVRLTLVHAIYDGAKIPEESEVLKLLGTTEEQCNVIGLFFPKYRKIPGHYLRESYQFSCAVYEKLKDEWADFDFIYAKGFTSWCLLEHKKKGIHIAPVGVKFHGYEMFQIPPNFKVKLTQHLLRPPVIFINRNANIVFSYGAVITEIIENIGVAREDIIEIGSAVDADWMVEKPSAQLGRRKFLFIGRDERRKGIEELIQCAPIFAETQTEMHWVGPIPKSKQIHDPGHFYYGEIRDTQQLKVVIDTCQVLIVPSFSEGMPNVILEAMARGLAIIASSVGAIPNMISHQNGRLIAPGKLKELRAAIREMATLPETKLDKMRSESIRIVNEKFNWDAVADATIKSIRAVTYSDTHPRDFKEE